MLNRITALSLVAFFTLGVAACRKPSDASAASGASADPAKQEPPKPMPAQLPEVIARVNGEEVKKTDFEMIVRNFELGQGAVPQEKRDEVLRSLLDQLIAHKLLYQESNARKFIVTDAEVDERMKALRDQFADAAAYQKALDARNMTEERLRADTRVEIAIKKLIDSETAAAIDVTDEDARQFYDKNPDKFGQGESVRVLHIVIAVDEKADAAVRKKKRAEIDAILKRARAGEDFSALAKAHSQDGSAPIGGELGFFQRGRMEPAFEKAAFALKPGQISDVVETTYGYHIIKHVEWRPPTVLPFDEVRPQIKHHLTMQRFKTGVETLIAQLKKKAKIEVLV